MLSGPRECPATDDGFFCTNEEGHPGRHVALDLNDEAVHTWPQTEVS